MPTTVWRHPEVWRLRGAHLALQKTIEKSRHLIVTIQFEHLEREFQELDSLAIRLAKEAMGLKESKESDAKSIRLLADRLVDYYQRYGALERRLDTELKQNGLDDAASGLRTG